VCIFSGGDVEDAHGDKHDVRVMMAMVMVVDGDDASDGDFVVSRCVCFTYIVLFSS